jgi:hypothetical protein
MGVEVSMNRGMNKDQNALRHVLGPALLVAITFAGHAASAQGTDKATRDLLIQKLTQVYSSLAPADQARTALTLRLADLHAERARLAAMEELEKGCTVCEAGKEDRARAIRYYQEVLPKLSEQQTAKVLPQIGHLYQMTGQDQQATATYQQVIRENKAPAAVAEAHLSLAEMNFKRRDYPTARRHYQAVMENPSANAKGLAAYRLAWCDFNMGDLEKAIAGAQSILKSPELSSRSAAAGVVQVDRQFQEEVSRDLATFLARRNVTTQDAKMLFDLSPETAKLTNVVYLANEAERLGQKANALALWRFSQERQVKPRAKVEAHLRIAQLEMEQKNPKAAGQEFDLAMNLWPSAVGNAGDDEAKELKARLRKLVLDWNREEKKSPSDELAMAYKSYLKIFAEADMTVWAAQALREKKDYPTSVGLFGEGAKLFKGQLTSADAATKKVVTEGLESALLGAIETAELAKDQNLLMTAYDSYLQNSVERKREIEVLYQKANITYEKSDYASAAEQMRQIAFMTAAKSPDALKVRQQAADLSLDALVLLKDDERIEKWAKDFAQLFPKEAADYARVARKSVLTQSVALAQGEQANLDRAWQVLSRFDLSTSTSEDKIAFYRNRLILAEKSQRFTEAREAADQLIKMPGVAVEDVQYALSRKAWLSELILDFDGALAATEKIQANKDVPEDARLLKLAMYADLANRDSKPYLAKYMGVSKDEEKALTIAMQLVRESKDPAKELEKQKTVLLKKPEVYAQLALEIAAQSKAAADYANKQLAIKSVVGTQAGRILARISILADVEAVAQQFSAHAIDGSQQKKLAATLKARIAMIEKLEKIAQRAVESGDWSAQLVSLDLLAKESDRFYSEILSLPVPAGLTGEDEQQYLALLSQQAAPYQIKAQDVKKKVDEFWSNSSAVKALESSLVTSAGPLRALVVKEIQILANIAPESTRANLTALAARPEAKTDAKPNLVAIESARQAVRESPMSRDRIEALLQLERQAGRVSMVSYLEGRLANLGGQATSTGKQ